LSIGVTNNNHCLEKLDAIAYAMSDNEAISPDKAQAKLSHTIDRVSQK